MMAMGMIDFQKARELAEAYVAEFERECGIGLVIVDADTVEFEGGWIFYWDSKAYLQTQDFADAIGGNAPIVVFKDGVIKQAPTAYAKPDEILAWLRRNP